MKIAVPVTGNNQVDDHFGHCKFYKVFTLSNEGKIIDRKIIPSAEGCGCKSNIAGELAADGVSILLAGGIGNGAIQVLNHAGIEVIRGCSGDVEDLIGDYAAGSLTDSGESCHHHHAHHLEGSDHTCIHGAN